MLIQHREALWGCRSSGIQNIVIAFAFTGGGGMFLSLFFFLFFLLLRLVVHAIAEILKQLAIGTLGEELYQALRGYIYIFVCVGGFVRYLEESY